MFDFLSCENKINANINNQTLYIYILMGEKVKIVSRLFIT